MYIIIYHFLIKKLKKFFEIKNVPQLFKYSNNFLFSQQFKQTFFSITTIEMKFEIQKIHMVLTIEMKIF